MAAIEDSWRALLGCRHEAQHKDALQREVQQQLARLRARLEHVRAASVEQRSLAASAAAAARQVAGQLPGCLGRVCQLLGQEESLVGDTQQGLEAVIKITNGIDSLAEIHSMAVALECEQQQLVLKAQELQALSAHLSAAIESASSAAAAVAGGGGGMGAIGVQQKQQQRQLLEMHHHGGHAQQVHPHQQKHQGIIISTTTGGIVPASSSGKQVCGCASLLVGLVLCCCWLGWFFLASVGWVGLGWFFVACVPLVVDVPATRNPAAYP